MRLFREKWEITIIPIAFIIAITMCIVLEGCKDGDNKVPEEIQKTEKHTSSEDINNDSPAKPDENDTNSNPNENNAEPVNPIDDDNNKITEDDTKIPDENTEIPENLTNFTGEITICMTNNTYGQVKPCG